ncbi:MAG: hypothetical protein QW197_00015 [Candidatus Aenigmatarchaeota archaeon]
MSYKVGRRFEYHVVYKLRSFGFDAKRVTLSGKRSEFYPACDVIVKIGENILKGKLKTTKKKEYVSIPLQDFIELSQNVIHFLCFGFYRTKPYFIVNIQKENLANIEKNGKKFISFSKKDVENLPINILIKEINKNFLIVSLEDFVNILKNLEAQKLPL